MVSQSPDEIYPNLPSRHANTGSILADNFSAVDPDPDVEAGEAEELPVVDVAPVMIGNYFIPAGPDDTPGELVPGEDDITPESNGEDQ